MSLLKNLVLVSLCVLCLAASAQASMIDNLMGYWGFDGNLLDTSGNLANNGNGTWHGTVNTSPVYAAGKFGQAVSLTHSDNDWVTIGGTPSYWDPNNFPGPAQNKFNFTISMWFTITTSTPFAYQCLIAQGEGSTWRISRVAARATSWASVAITIPTSPPPAGSRSPTATGISSSAFTRTIRVEPRTISDMDTSMAS